METIICAVDFTPASREALVCAVNLAKSLRTTLEIVHVVRPPATLLSDPPLSLLLADLREAAERELASEAAKVRAQDVRVTTWVGTGFAAEGVVARIAELGASLVVAGSHARGDGSRRFVGSVAERLVRMAPCPVLVVPPGGQALASWSSAKRPLRITAALDLSRASDGSLELLHRLEERIPCELHLLHVYWPPREHQRLGLGPPDPYEADPEAVAVLSRELEGRIGPRLGKSRRSLRVRPTWGAEDNALAWEAETDDADLLVVGTSQSREGSTAVDTIRTSRLPVLCVPARLARPQPEPLTRIRHVLVTTDFSAPANAAVAEAYRLVLGGGVVTLVNVNQEELLTLAPDRKNELETSLLALVPPGVNPHTIRTRVLIAEGKSPGEAIVQAIHRVGPDLVVLASHGRAGLSRALRGSVADHVLHHSPRPVLVVPWTVPPPDLDRELLRAR